MKKEQIYSRLAELSSYFSFGRILGYVAIFETIGIETQLIHGQEDRKSRMISAELNFLTGLWMNNVDLDKTWGISLDDRIIEEVYSLMNQIHDIFLSDDSVSGQFVETFLYEGDMSYDWQSVYFAEKKYADPNLCMVLQTQFKFNPNVLTSTLSKIKHRLESQINQRIEEKNKKHDYISPMNAFTIKTNVANKLFTKEELEVIDSLSFELGKEVSKTQISSMLDFNVFYQQPIIKLPDNRGYFFVNEHAVSVAMNETPFYWLCDNSFYGKKTGTIRGNIAEQLVLDIVNRRFPNAFSHIDIKKRKSSNRITDIDVFYSYKSDGVVFQVKSKRLTELSKKGDLESLERDCKAAIIDAHEQGLKCKNCLKNASQYYSLNKNGLAFAENLKFMYNICITLDAFPGIATICYLKNFDYKQNPIMAMSLYDLDIVFYLFLPNTIMDYFRFRYQCMLHGIYGINEVYYIGAYMANTLGEYPKLHNNKIPREYALYADYIIKKSREYEFSNKDVDCDLLSLLRKYPLKAPITCQ